MLETWSKNLACQQHPASSLAKGGCGGGRFLDLPATIVFGTSFVQLGVLVTGYAAVGGALRPPFRCQASAFMPSAKPRRSASCATWPTLWARPTGHMVSFSVRCLASASGRRRFRPGGHTNR
jgi:hypothetical protein